MHQLTVIGNAAKTMTSREIAELTGKEHKNVLADIRDMLAALALDTADFSAVYRSENGQYYDCFKLPERECLILVSGYSVAMRAKIIDRWKELENQTVQPVIDLNNPEHLRGLLGSYAEKAIVLQSQLALAAPKVAALDRLTLADNLLCLTDAAKHLGMEPRKLNAWLSANDWIYKRAGGKHWIAYQPRLKSGLLDHKLTTVKRADGSEKHTEQVLVTAKGLAKLAQVAA